MGVAETPAVPASLGSTRPGPAHPTSGRMCWGTVSPLQTEGGLSPCWREGPSRRCPCRGAAEVGALLIRRRACGAVGGASTQAHMWEHLPARIPSGSLQGMCPYIWDRCREWPEALGPVLGGCSLVCILESSPWGGAQGAEAGLVATFSVDGQWYGLELGHRAS